MAKRRGKLDFFFSGSTSGSPVLSMLDSGWENEPEVMLTNEDWDTPMNPVRVMADKPTTGSGGTYIDAFPTRPGKLLTVEFHLVSTDPYRLYQLNRIVRSLSESNSLISIRRTQEFPEHNVKVVDWLNDCAFTDVASKEVANFAAHKYGFVLKSKNQDSTTPVESAL